MMLWFAGFVSAHIFWLLVLFGLMVWESRSFPFVTRRPTKWTVKRQPNGTYLHERDK